MLTHHPVLQFRARASCLSFDVLKDRLGPREGYPITAYTVAGTQADKGKKNSVIIMKMSNLNREQKGEDSGFDQGIFSSIAEQSYPDLPFYRGACASPGKSVFTDLYKNSPCI